MCISLPAGAQTVSTEPKVSTAISGHASVEERGNRIGAWHHISYHIRQPGNHIRWTTINNYWYITNNDCTIVNLAVHQQTIDKQTTQSKGMNTYMQSRDRTLIYIICFVGGASASITHSTANYKVTHQIRHMRTWQLSDNDKPRTITTITCIHVHYTFSVLNIAILYLLVVGMQ